MAKRSPSRRARKLLAGFLFAGAALGSTEEAFKLARSYAADQMLIVLSSVGRKDLLAA